MGTGDAAQLCSSITCARPTPCRTLFKGTLGLRALRQSSEELEKALESWRG